MNISEARGYDASQTDRGSDELDRWRLAADIVDVALTTPADWSVRIGIFAKWGEGKSTVLRFAEKILTERKNVVFSFSPWSIREWNDLWDDFGDRLSEALSSAGIKVGGSLRAAGRASSKWAESRGFADAAGAAAALVGKRRYMRLLLAS